MRISPLVLFLLASVSLLPAAPVEHGQLDASQALFAVLAAANAAGYDAGLNSSPPIRAQIRERIEATHAPILEELKSWYTKHPQRDHALDLARFVSLGLSIQDPPAFGWSTHENDVPPDAMAMDEFRQMLPRFWEQTKAGDLWAASQKAIEQMLELNQESIARSILEVNGYLRNSTAGYLGRRFQVFLDLLGAPNQVQTRSYGDNYFVVLTPSMEQKQGEWRPAGPHIFEIRHAYLRYLIDPLAIKYGMDLKQKESLQDIAQGAPLLKEPYRTHFDLLATECLIKAIESRMAKNPSLVTAAVREGYVLTPYFAEQLVAYEKQPESMRLFFPGTVQRIDLAHETKRLEKVEFDKENSRPVPAESAATVTSAAARTVAEADAYYDNKDLENAATLYRRALEQPGSPGDHAAAYYGLAHVALLRNDGAQASELFHKTLDSSPDQEIRSWTCYYLGRLSAVAREREEAIKWFQQAISAPGGNAKAVESSRRELAKLTAQPE